MKINALWAVALGVFAWGAQFAAQAQQNDAADGDWAAGATWGNALGHPLGETYTIDSNTVSTITNTNFSAATSITVAAGGTFAWDLGVGGNNQNRTAQTDIILDGGTMALRGNPNNGNRFHQLVGEGAGNDFTVSSASTISHEAVHSNNQFITYSIRSQSFTINDRLTLDLNNASVGGANAGLSRRIVRLDNRGNTNDINGTGDILVLGNNANDRLQISAPSGGSDFTVNVPIRLNTARLQFVGVNGGEIEMAANILNNNNNGNNQVEINAPTVTISSTGNTYQGQTVLSGDADLNVTGDISSSNNVIDNGNNLVLSGTGTVGGIVLDGERGNNDTRVKNDNVTLRIGDVNAVAPTASTLTAEGNVLLGRGVRLSGNNTGNQPYLTDTVLEVDLFSNMVNDTLAGDGANTLILNDILKPILQGAYAPMFGDQFQVFSNFASITLGQHFRLDTSMALLGPGLGWDTSLLQSQGILAVGAPEPGTTLPLLVLAAGLLACYRPRRARAMAETEAATPA